jgi:3-oxoacyl-[acyl-carrier protein] reductase
MPIMLLAGKKAAVFGAGGKIGRAVALAFAREGATVFLSGRRLENVEAVAADIRRAGGVAEAAEVDALDKRAIDNYMEQLESRAGGVDVVLNAMGFQPVQGVPLADLSVSDFTYPILTWTWTSSQLLTARSAARSMARRGGGV